MDFDKLRAGMQGIVELVRDVPDEFKSRAFDALLSALLDESKAVQPPPSPAGVAGAAPAPVVAPAEPADSPSLPTPAQVKVLMQQTSLTREELAKVVTVVEGEVHFLREPDHGKLAQGQGEWALLLALKAALEGGALAADPEAVRSICQEKGFYDRANFAKNFASPKYAAWFKAPLESQGEPQPLSNEGRKALADLLRKLGSQAQ
jgi:hypothetical protein